jgi:hypothetical protein
LGSSETNETLRLEARQMTSWPHSLCSRLLMMVLAVPSIISFMRPGRRLPRGSQHSLGVFCPQLLGQPLSQQSVFTCLVVTKVGITFARSVR